MPKILYPQVIEEDPHELEKLEKHHRYTHLFQRVRMLRLLKSGECSNLGEAAEALGYSWRQSQRWFASYRDGGLKELLKSRVDERGRQELVTPETFEELQEAMKWGEIATIRQADEFLKKRGIEYSHPDGVGQLLRRRKVKLKTGEGLATRKPTQRNKRLSKKLRREGKAGRRARWPPKARQTAEDRSLRRGSLWPHQLAQKALLPKGVSSALHRQALLQVDLPVCSTRAYNGRELLPLPARDGRKMPAELP